MDRISVVIPFLNEEDCIIKLCERMENIVKSSPYELELVFVDDGSTDETVRLINGFKFVYCKKIILIRFSKNFGSHSAIRAGILHSTGNYFTYISADLQEPIDMLNVMYENIKKGYEAVYIEKGNIAIGRVERLFSLSYSALMRRFAVKNYGFGGISNIMFCSTIRDYINDNIETNSSIILQIINAGFKNITINMDYKARTAGKSKWTATKKIKLLIDSFVSFSYLPIRCVSVFGIIMAVSGFVFGIYIIISRLLNPELSVAGYATLAALLLFGFGMTNISLGIIAEYLWRTYDAARSSPAFIISDIQKIKEDTK